MQCIHEDRRKRIVEDKEVVTFSSFSSYHLIEITARAKNEKQISKQTTDDEEITVTIDDRRYPKLGTKEAAQDSPASFSGGKLHNLAKTVYVLTFLKGKDHTITLKTDHPSHNATLESLQIYTLNPNPKLSLQPKLQAEDGDRRPWITFVLDTIALRSIAMTITYSRRKRDSDDVKIIIDGTTQGNLLTGIKHFLWRFVGSLLPWWSPTKTETETFIVALPRGLHYIELNADRMPIMENVVFEFAQELPIPQGIPMADNPTWTKDFYEDTETILLARAIYGEAGGESFRAKVAVGWAIRNRVEDPANRWRKTYHEVILAESQYDSLWNRWTYDKIRNPSTNDPKEKKAWKESYDAAQKVIDGTIGDPINGANHFYATTIPKPNWADENKFTIQIGITRFYKL